MGFHDNCDTYFLLSFSCAFRRTGKLLIAQDVRDKAGGSTELMDTAHDDPVCISISSTADCSARTTPCEITGVQATVN